MTTRPMADRMLRLGTQPWARQMARGLGLPPLPVELPRTNRARERRYLGDRAVALGGGDAPSEAWSLLRATIEEAGGVLDDSPRVPLAAVVFDATAFTRSSQLSNLHAFLHERVERLEVGGRVVIVGRELSEDPDLRLGVASTQAALEGFTRSLGKELGKKGGTANLIRVEPGAEARIAAPLRFLLGMRSAFVDLQVLRVGASVPGKPDGPWTRPLAGKTALVTGAARGIGAAIARVLASEGARVVGLDRPEEAEALEAVIEPLGGTVLRHNLLADDTPERCALHLSAEYGGVDIVVHNAGITRDKTLKSMKRLQWDEVIATNLEATLQLDKRLRKGVLLDQGRLIYMSSISGIAGNFGQTNYAASKAGLIGHVRALAPRLAARGITVNAVAPGFIETEMTAAMPASIRRIARRMSTLNQGGLPTDVAEAVTFLATGPACGLSGSVLRVCGGALIGA